MSLVNILFFKKELYKLTDLEIKDHILKETYTFINIHVLQYLKYY